MGLLMGKALSSLPWSVWFIMGLLLMGIQGSIALLSSGFTYGDSALEKPIVSFVVLLVVGSYIYLLMVRAVAAEREKKTALLLWFFFVGVVLRLQFLTSAPILEDDLYRYLWDGAVLVEGFNPYRYPPEQILNGGGQRIPEKLVQLAIHSEGIAARINHPGLTTIYPPVAQLFLDFPICWRRGAYRHGD